MQEKGTISINTENIFPIIKKFLYSDHEIFLRELVSNAVDASQKIKRLSSMGNLEDDLGELLVEVKIDKEAKTITISDRGIGMTADEIKKYINQIAFSGATEFIEKFKEAKDANEIIGKFGLGFYSSFMVAEKVEILSRSYQKDTEAVRWTCDGSTSFEIESAEREQRGTDVILYINEESLEFLEDTRIGGILNKYCKFLPVDIKFGERDEQIPDGEDEEGKPKFKTVKSDNIINNTHPIWVKAPTDLKDEDYLSFYRELYPFSEDPLFWIHLNVDYPFNLTGILYFPKVKNDFEINKNKIQLYSRQVFITDEVKDVVPEFLMLLHGVIDSPDIPLNVSRSFLQSDSNVKKINSYITKKVADKLAEIFKNDRNAYEEKWEDIGLFVKYGMIADEKFLEKANDFVLFKNIESKHFTIEEYKTHIGETQKDKDDNLVMLYASDRGKQDAYIQSAIKRGYDVLVFDGILDSHFINLLEQKQEKVQIKRVDADIIDKLIDKDETLESSLTEEQKTEVKEVFETAINNTNHTVTVESLPVDELPVVITLPEFMRRMKDMAKTGGGGMAMMGAMPDQFQVSVNANHPIVQKIVNAKKKPTKEKFAKQAFDLALLSQGMLEGSGLTDFINRSVDILSK